MNILSIFKHFNYNRQFNNIIFLYFIGIIFWLCLVVYREFYKLDVSVLRYDIFDGCNGWCIAHFFHYLLLAYFAPNYWKMLIIIGILFEIIEIPLNKFSKYIDSKLIEDSLTNSLGVFSGLLLYNLFPNYIDLFKIFLQN